VPYRVDLPDGSDDTFDRLVELGALDVERSQDGGLAALVPDSVAPQRLAEALGAATVDVSPALGRDDGSTWVLSQRSMRIGDLVIVPAGGDERGDLELTDAAVFGTGFHPTTALCLRALQDAVRPTMPREVLDVGTGSGVLALAALKLGVPRAVALDVDEDALRVAAENARINNLDDRLELRRGGPESVAGAWPLVLANVLAAPLIEMAPVLVRRLGHHAQLILSGVPAAAGRDVDQAYRRLGLRQERVASEGGWVALVLRATW
jgi:ribosomal protein L11 methyltransferase